MTEIKSEIEKAKKAAQLREAGAGFLMASVIVLWRYATDDDLAWYWNVSLGFLAGSAIRFTIRLITSAATYRVVADMRER